MGDQSALGKPVGSDLNEGAMTLPTVIYLQHHPGDSVIYKVIVERDKSLIPEAVSKIRDSGAIEECKKIAGEFYEKASGSLKKLPDCDARKSLKALVAFVIERNK